MEEEQTQLQIPTGKLARKMRTEWKLMVMLQQKQAPHLKARGSQDLDLHLRPHKTTILAMEMVLLVLNLKFPILHLPPVVVGIIKTLKAMGLLGVVGVRLFCSGGTGRGLGAPEEWH